MFQISCYYVFATSSISDNYINHIVKGLLLDFARAIDIVSTLTFLIVKLQEINDIVHYRTNVEP